MTNTGSAVQSLPTTRVEYDPSRRYPHVPVCTCGAEFRGYANEHAAKIVADAHECE